MTWKLGSRDLVDHEGKSKTAFPCIEGRTRCTRTMPFEAMVLHEAQSQHQDCHRCVVHRKCLWTLRSGKEGGDSTWQAVTYCQAYSVTVIPSLRA